MEGSGSILGWVDEEQKSLGTVADYEKLEALKIPENKITEITIDVGKKFETYDGTSVDGKPIKKAIIPVLHEGVRKNFWLNKKNPVYHQILDRAKKAGTPTLTVKIIRTGQAAATKYNIVD